jgi:hypothetical protein
MRITLRSLLVFGTTSLFALPAGLPAAEPTHMHPGKWEISMELEMEGMPPAANHGPRVVTQCLKAEDVKDAKSIAEANQKNRQGCTVSEPKWDGNKLSYSVACANGTTGHTEMTYEGDSYEGTGVMTVNSPQGGSMKVTQHIKGKRIGDC